MAALQAVLRELEPLAFKRFGRPAVRVTPGRVLFDLDGWKLVMSLEDIARATDPREVAAAIYQQAKHIRQFKRPGGFIGSPKGVTSGKD